MNCTHEDYRDYCAIAEADAKRLLAWLEFAADDPEAAEVMNTSGARLSQAERIKQLVELHPGSSAHELASNSKRDGHLVLNQVQIPRRIREIKGMQEAALRLARRGEDRASLGGGDGIKAWEPP